jgi:hypothetical protein
LGVAARVLLALAAAGAVPLTAPGSAVASAVCPPPGTLADIIAVDADNAGPLTEQFRPIYGVYAEGAAACWPGQEVAFTGFISSPEGLGGTRPFTIEPAWLVSQAHFLSTSAAVDAEAGPVGPFFPVAVPPRLEARFTGLAGHWVRASGHFDDKIAKSCVVTMGDPGSNGVPTAEQAIQICRTSFVLTAVGPLTAPDTDTDASDGADDASPGWFALLLAATAVAAFVLSLGRPSRRSVIH